VTQSGHHRAEGRKPLRRRSTTQNPVQLLGTNTPVSKSPLTFIFLNLLLLKSVFNAPFIKISFYFFFNLLLLKSVLMLPLSKSPCDEPLRSVGEQGVGCNNYRMVQNTHRHFSKA